MREQAQIQPSAVTERIMQKAENENGYVWSVCGAGLGFIGGVLAPVFGVILTAASWIEGASSPGPLLHKAGTLCFYLTVPLLILGGYCLDAMEKRGWKIG